MGMQGDQSLNSGQNRTLANSHQIDDLGIFLFEVFNPKVYTYQGQVQLAGEPYQKTQADINKVQRKVWIFPLKLVDREAPTLLSEDIYENINQQRERFANRLSSEELKERAGRAKEVPGERNISAKRFERDPYVAEWAKRKANGICQLCNSPAPFITIQGDPFLETHHIIPLGQNGKDSIENTVALCPNCHRKMDVLNLPEDKDQLTRRAIFL
jgi:5-methylcytosine-specific restriction protein A